MDAAMKLADELELAVDNVFGPTKEDQLKALKEKALAAVPDAEKQDGTVQKAQALSLRGRVLCAYPDGDEEEKEGEALLSKAAKMNSKCCYSWNALGHYYWTQGKLKEASDAYSGSLHADENNLNALRSYALVLRSMGGGENMQKAEDHTKKALAKGLTNGESWYAHGMVYLAKYFSLTFDQDDLRAALKAFNLAEKNGRQHPDLHMNRAQCQKYLANWTEMLGSLDEALKLDPDFEEAKDAQKMMNDLFAYLTKKYMTFSGMKEKQLAKVIKSLPPAPGEKTIRGITVNTMPLSDLTEEEGVVEDANCVAVRVLEVIDDTHLPMLYLAVDSNKTRCILAVYGIHRAAITSSAEIVYGNPAYYNRKVPVEEPWPCLTLVIDRSSAVTIGGRLIEKRQWSSIDYSVRRKTKNNSSI
eukprot:TRINITY_DN6136_c0_g1_i1.p1 TRINITY_DN6136_c0_g1~~TRINITY_DN6136_c0_g1_i1.p1  ORF type:complete len:415 (+),score=208.21 TRINITY_DN6136_c0_g1_i1:62-1306(+)